MDTPEDASQQIQSDETILKQKKPRKQMDPETRQKMADHMRKVNQERMDRARLANEAKLQQKEQEILEFAQKRLEKVEAKKEVIKKLKEKKGIPEEPVASPQPVEKTKSKPKKKQVIVEVSSSDSDESGDTDSEGEDEIIYVAKKAAKKPSKKNESIVKPKKQANTQAIPDSTPKTVIKFI